MINKFLKKFMYGVMEGNIGEICQYYRCYSLKLIRKYYDLWVCQIAKL